LWIAGIALEVVTSIVTNLTSLGLSIRKENKNLRVFAVQLSLNAPTISMIAVINAALNTKTTFSSTTSAQTTLTNAVLMRAGLTLVAPNQVTSVPSSRSLDKSKEVKPAPTTSSHGVELLPSNLLVQVLGLMLVIGTLLGLSLKLK